MKKNFAIFPMVFLFLFLSCKKTDKDRENQSINAGIEQLNLNNHVNWLIILPNLGCTGCIQEGEAFMKDNITNQKIFFVITKLESLKILEQKIGRKIVGLPNVFIDRKKTFAIPTSNQIYPCIVRLASGQNVEHEFQSPKNGQAFDQLKLKINL